MEFTNISDSKHSLFDPLDCRASIYAQFRFIAKTNGKEIENSRRALMVFPSRLQIHETETSRDIFPIRHAISNTQTIISRVYDMALCEFIFLFAPKC